MMTDEETITTVQDSFVNVMDIEQDENVIQMKVIPRNDVIGTGSNVSTTQICVSMKARQLTIETEDRAPVDLEVAFDVSGSMAGNKLELCKITLELLLRHLLPQDRFGLVSYSDDANVEIPLQFMTTTNKKVALKKIKKLYARGWTNISDAISLAIGELRGPKNPNKVQSVFLLTDGYANTGVCDFAGLVELTKNCVLANPSASKSDGYSQRKPMSGLFGSFLGKKKAEEERVSNQVKIVEKNPISVFCFGYGNDHNSSLLRAISEAAFNGSYYHVKDDSDVGAAFGDAMGGLLSVLAQSVMLTIETANKDVTIKKVHHDRTLKRDDGRYTVNVGDFYAEEERDVLIEVTLAPNTSGTSAPIQHITVSLAYTDIIAKKPVQSDRMAAVIVRPGGMQISEDNEHVVSQWLRIMTAQEMEAATQFASRNDLASARQCLKRALDEIAKSNVNDSEMVRQLHSDLETASAGLASQESYVVGGGGHYLAFKSQSHARQRCSEAAPAYAASVNNMCCAPTYKDQCYATSSKKSFAMKFNISKKSDP